MSYMHFVFDSLQKKVICDLHDLLDSQFGEAEYLDEVKDLASKIVRDRFNDFAKRNLTIMDYREMIQDDLICLLDSQFGEVEYVNEVKNLACQIVVDRFKASFPSFIKD